MIPPVDIAKLGSGIHVSYVGKLLDPISRFFFFLNLYVICILVPKTIFDGDDKFKTL